MADKSDKVKNKKVIAILVLAIVLMSIVANLAGLITNDGEGQHEFTSITGERVEIYGKGVYKNDSISLVAQGKAVDLVTLIMGVPLLLMALFMVSKDSFRGRLLLTGTLGYFLYTYVSYVFLWSYNPLFLLYVALMALSLYAFVLSMMSFDLARIKEQFTLKLPRKTLGGFQIFIGIVLVALWLNRILASPVPDGLEHYTTLVIQGMDLGIVVPTAMLSGVLLIKNKPYGYLLSSVLIVKAVAMFAAICAMIVSQAIEGIQVGIVESSIFVLLTLFSVYCLVLLLKNVIKITQEV